MDYSTTTIASTGGRPSTIYHLTVKAFSEWSIDAPNKEIGKLIRQYVLGQAFKSIATSAPPTQVLPASAVTMPPEELAVALVERKRAFEMGMAERQTAMDEKRVELFQKRLALYKELGFDERDKLRLKDELMTQTCTPAAFLASQVTLAPSSSQQQLIENAPSSSSRPLTLSAWAIETGKGKLSPGMASKLGARVAVLYRARHDNRDPPKHQQYVDGAMRLVNSYTYDDEDIVEQAFESL